MIDKCLCFLLCLCLWFASADASTYLNALHFNQFATPEGLPNNKVQQVYQDKDGFIWIATAYGLFRYDGYDINVLKSNLYTPGRLPNNNVICVMEDNAHRLWIGTHEGVCVMDKRTGIIRPMELKGVSKQRVNDILVTRAGKIYLGYIRGLARYDESGDSLVLMSAKNSQGVVPERENIQALLEDENGDVLIGTWNNGLLRLREGNNEFMVYENTKGMDSVLSLFRDSRGTLWVGTNGNGLFKARFTSDLRGMHVENFKHVSSASTSIPSDYVQAIHEDLQTASIWVGTRNGLGVMVLAKEGFFINYDEHSEEHKFPVCNISSVLRDRNGFMWVGSEGTGLFYADTRPVIFQTIGKEEQVNMMFLEDSGRLWIGQERGVGYADSMGKHVFASARRPQDIVYSSSTMEVLLAIQDEGILACKDGKLVRQYKKDRCNFIPDNLVFAIREDLNGNWWIGSYKGLGVRYQDGREYVFGNSGKMRGIPQGEITTLEIENDSSLWMTAGTGQVVHVTGCLNMPDSLCGKSYDLSVGMPLCLFIDRNERVWVGTEGGGLYLYNAREDCFESVHQRYHLPGDMVGSIEEDKMGNLWLGTNCGLVRLSVTGAKKGQVRTFTVADGLPDNFFNPRASCSKDGKLYFGCSRGIVVFSPEMVREEKMNAVPRITDIQVDGVSLEQYEEKEREQISPYSPDFTQELHIPAKYAGFSLKFAMLTYNHPQQNRYAYRLKGFDDEWHFADMNVREVHYARIPFGTYVFELRAANGDGGWSDVRTLKVVIEASFWHTGWAYVLYIIGAIVALGFIGDGFRRLSRMLSLSVWYKRVQGLLKRKKNENRNELAIEIKRPDYTDADEEFLQKAVDCVNRHLSEPAFDIPQFIEEMATSRTTLHKRLKVLTGLNATGFIRNIRLKAAYKLISENRNIRISDLAYRVGFNDPKYFSLCFKKEFGVHPSEFKNNVAEVESCSQKADET